MLLENEFLLVYWCTVNCFRNSLFTFFIIKSKSCFDIKSRLMKTLFFPLVRLVLYVVEKRLLSCTDAVKFCFQRHIFAQSFWVIHVFLTPLSFLQLRSCLIFWFYSLAEDKECNFLAKISKVPNIVDCECCFHEPLMTIL